MFKADESINNEIERKRRFSEAVAMRCSVKKVFLKI